MCGPTNFRNWYAFWLAAYFLVNGTLLLLLLRTTCTFFLSFRSVVRDLFLKAVRAFVASPPPPPPCYVVQQRLSRGSSPRFLRGCPALSSLPRANRSLVTLFLPVAALRCVLAREGPSPATKHRTAARPTMLMTDLLADSDPHGVANPLESSPPPAFWLLGWCRVLVNAIVMPRRLRGRR